ncbi:MAG: hypothetical protein ACR2P2_03625 [Nakamurella sp.]
MPTTHRDAQRNNSVTTGPELGSNAGGPSAPAACGQRAPCRVSFAAHRSPAA